MVTHRDKVGILRTVRALIWRLFFSHAHFKLLNVFRDKPKFFDKVTPLVGEMVSVMDGVSMRRKILVKLHSESTICMCTCMCIPILQTLTYIMIILHRVQYGVARDWVCGIVMPLVDNDIHGRVQYQLLTAAPSVYSCDQATCTCRHNVRCLLY